MRFLRLAACSIRNSKAGRNFSTGTSINQHNKVFQCVEDALRDIPSNITLLSGGFGLCGLPQTLLDALSRKQEVTNITAVSNNAGVGDGGLGPMLASGQITKMIASYVGENKIFERMYLNGQIEVDLIPQGTLAEKLRAGGAGIPAFFTPAGVDTMIETGEMPSKFSHDGSGKVIKFQKEREARHFDGRKYIMEESIKGDYAFVKAYKADKAGNLVFRLAANNFNGAMARCAKITIVEAEHIVECGEIHPNEVHVPGIYVDRIIQSTSEKRIEKFTFSASKEEKLASLSSGSSEALVKRTRIIKRAAQEFKDGMYANLGIGMPMLAPDYIQEDVRVTLQSENGILGMGKYPTKGQEDPDLINAGKETVTLLSNASLFGSEESFGMIRAGRIDLTMLGAMQVSKHGDLANWMLPGKIKGMGGAMDLVANPAKTKVVVVMEHTSKGKPKILNSCRFPLTGSRCVSRIITDLCVFDVDPENGLTLIELAEGSTEADIRAATEADFNVSETLKSMDQ